MCYVIRCALRYDGLAVMSAAARWPSRRLQGIALDGRMDTGKSIPDFMVSRF